MLFPVRQRLRSSLPIGLLVVALGVNTTAGAVGALQVAELVTACGRSAVIAANHLEPNGAGKIRLAADAFRMTNAILALFNHSVDGRTTPYFYNSLWGGIDAAAFAQHLQTASADAAVGIEPSTEQEADETFERIALVLLNDILPAIETAASVGVAVNGMLDENHENPRWRICLQSLTSLSRTLQVCCENRNTPEAQRYIGIAVAHTLLTLWEFFRDFNVPPPTSTPTATNPTNPTSACAQVAPAQSTASTTTAMPTAAVTNSVVADNSAANTTSTVVSASALPVATVDRPADGSAPIPAVTPAPIQQVTVLPATSSTTTGATAATTESVVAGSSAASTASTVVPAIAVMLQQNRPTPMSIPQTLVLSAASSTAAESASAASTPTPTRHYPVKMGPVIMGDGTPRDVH